MNQRTFNIFSIILILVWIWADKYLSIGAPSYGWLLLVYVTVLFCGSYFIRMGFFLKSICSVKTTDKKIALSFDDGPDASTSRLLDLLKENQVEAVFFCIGRKISGNEEQIRRMVQEGHIIGNHSFTHSPFFDFFGSGRMLRDMSEMNLVIKNLTGLTPRFFRPPFGVTNPNVKKAVIKGGFISIGWSIRSYDTVIENRDRLMKKILSALRPGAILLLHDTSETTVAVLPELLKAIQQKDFQIVRLDKLVNLKPYE